jgi:hypothetical protein
MPDNIEATVTVPKELLDLMRSLPSLHFAGALHPGMMAAAECSCQNCGCDSRAGGSCACNERCTCQGHTANHLDWAMNVLLGAAAHVPLDDVKKIVSLRDQIHAARTKAPNK